MANNCGADFHSADAVLFANPKAGARTENLRYEYRRGPAAASINSQAKAPECAYNFIYEQ